MPRLNPFAHSLFFFSLLAKLWAEDATTRPNILFCMADDWGWPHAGAYGDKIVKTPTFDRLAKEGVLFNRAFVSSPSCTPSRNAILTGQQFYRLEQGASLRGTLDRNYPNFLFRLRDTGYEIGNWRKVWGPGNFKTGGYKEHPCGPQGSFEKFLRKRNPKKPFCFWLGTSDPHRPYVKRSGAKSGIQTDPIRTPLFYPDSDEIRNDIADYYFEVERWDRDVGKAMALLREIGELENTIVVMTGDHGMPFPRCKANLYDWGARVPLALRWGTRVAKGMRLSGFVSLTDLAPTFLEAAGVDIPPEMTGRSLLSLMRQGKEQDRSFVVYGRERHTPAQQKPSNHGYPSRALRTGQWLLILNLTPERWPVGVPKGATHRIDVFSDCDDSPTKSVILGLKNDPDKKKYFDLCFGKRPAVELYDCNKDPDQVQNLAKDPEYSKLIQTLKEKLVAYLHSTGDPRFTEKPVLFDKYPYKK